MFTKLFLITTFLLYYNHSIAQAYKFKAFDVLVKEKSDETEVRENDWHHADYLVVVNFDKKKIQSFGNEEESLDIIQTLPTIVDKDNNKTISWQTINNSGDKCKVSLMIYADKSTPHIASLAIEYKYATVYLKLKKDE